MLYCFLAWEAQAGSSDPIHWLQDSKEADGARTDIQTDRPTDRQTDIQTDRQTDRHYTHHAHAHTKTLHT